MSSERWVSKGSPSPSVAVLPGGLQPGGRPPSAGVGELKANPTDLWVGGGQLYLPRLEGSQQQTPVSDRALLPPHGVAVLPPEEKGGQHRDAVPKELSTAQRAQCKLQAWDANYPWLQPTWCSPLASLPSDTPAISSHTSSMIYICLSWFLLLIPLPLLVYAGESSPQFQIMDASCS